VSKQQEIRQSIKRVCEKLSGNHYTDFLKQINVPLFLINIINTEGRLIKDSELQQIKDYILIYINKKYDDFDTIQNIIKYWSLETQLNDKQQKIFNVIKGNKEPIGVFEIVISAKTIEDESFYNILNELEEYGLIIKVKVKDDDYYEYKVKK
jgi:L-cystine uptake protein TcyP (sodium:dicarboxylate symporter family)